MYVIAIYIFTTYLYIASANGQPTADAYNVVHYSSNDGLPQNSITFIQFDKDGYCWLGTEMGLVRFDGTNFKVYNSDNIKGLHSSRMRIGRQDINGILYFENSDSDLLTLKYNALNISPEPVLSNDIPLLLPSIAGYPHKSPQRQHKPLPQSPFYFPNNEIVTPSGQTYVLHGNQLFYLYNGDTVLIDSNTADFTNNCLAFGDTIVFFDNNGKTKIYRGGKPLNHFLIDDGLLHNKEFLSGNFECFSNNNNEGDFLYADKTLYRVNVHDHKITGTIVLKNIDIPVISAVAYNPELNKYFIGSLTNGLFIVSPSDFYYPPYSSTAEKDGFFTQAVTNDMNAIISQRYLYYKNGTRKLLPINHYLGPSAYLSAQNQLYYGNDPFLLKLNLSTNRIDTILSLDSRPSVIMPDKYDRSNLLVCTSQSIYKLNNDRIISRTIIPPSRLNTNITGLAQMGKDTFVLATENGVYWYDYKKNNIYLNALDSLYIRNVYVENRNRIWVASYGQGFYLIDSGCITHMPYGPSDALKTVHAFIDDGKGVFWLPTNNGLYMVHKSSLLNYARNLTEDIYVYSYTTNNGLRTNEFNGGCYPPYVWLKDSMLSLPSLRGLVWFYPNDVHIQYPNKQIYIDFLMLNNKPVDIPANRTLILNPNFTNMALGISCPYFGNKENLKLYYKIQGLDSIWSPVSESRIIHINRIPPGTYSIVIRKETPDENNKNTFEAITIVIKKTFYQTPLFIASLCLLICATTFLIYYIRIKILKRRNEFLQSIISARTKNLTSAVSDLKRSKEQLEKTIRVKENIITILLHDLRTPIYYLNKKSGGAIKHYDGHSINENKQSLVEIHKSISGLFHFTQNFFIWAITQKKNFRPSMQRLSLQTVFEEVQTLYIDIARVNNNKLTVDPTELSCICDKNILFTIIRNLIDNANKNTHNGIIGLYANKDRKDNAISITVTDTGRGLTQKQIDNFFDTTRNNAYSGNGSMIIIDLAKSINARISVESAPNAGSRFTIHLNGINL